MKPIKQLKKKSKKKVAQVLRDFIKKLLIEPKYLD
jgi:hypothetical protein